MHVEFLGVGGFLVTVGDDAVMTAPLYTRPDMFTVETGLPVESDTAAVAAALPPSKVKNVRAVISGHAHYDHLLDVPAVLDLAPTALLYSNTSAKNLLDAYAPDRDATCSTTPVNAHPVARSRVIALDDPAASVVDYTNCPDQKPNGAPLAGKWTQVPNSNVRVLAVCSMHPDQIGPMHFAPGNVDTEQCTAPTGMPDWKEGPTIAFLVDFLDPKTHAPLYRFFYQDAPTNPPIGFVPTGFLDKRVDLALLCVGSYDHVNDAPSDIMTALAPRFSLGGHWEDFFSPASGAPQPLPLLDVPAWLTRARAAAPDGTDATPIIKNGAQDAARAFLPMPGDQFTIAP
jgi:hypothetical protein